MCDNFRVKFHYLFIIFDPGSCAQCGKAREAMVEFLNGCHDIFIASTSSIVPALVSYGCDKMTSTIYNLQASGFC